MKKTIFIISVLFLAVLLGGCALWPNNNQQPANQNQNDNQNQNQAADDEANLINDLKQLFVVKYNKSISDIAITIQSQDASHVRGSVQMGDGLGGGGYFFAAKVNGVWQLVLDGNGAISCQLLTSYNFPENMKTDCYNETADWQTYENSEAGLKFRYPNNWELSTTIKGARKTIILKDKVNGYAGNDYLVFNVAYTPNQAGSSLIDWTNEIEKTGNWQKSDDFTIGSLPANKLIASETEAGQRYIIISNNKMYDLQFISVSQAIINEILSSIIWL